MKLILITLSVILFFSGCYSDYNLELESDKDKIFHFTLFNNYSKNTLKAEVTTALKGQWHQNCYYEFSEKSIFDQLEDYGNFTVTLNEKQLNINYQTLYDYPELELSDNYSDVNISKTASQNVSADILNLVYPKSPLLDKLPDSFLINREEGFILQLPTEVVAAVIKIKNSYTDIETEKEFLNQLTCYFYDTKYIFITSDQIKLMPERENSNIIIGGVTDQIVTHLKGYHHYQIITGEKTVIEWQE